MMKELKNFHENTFNADVPEILPRITPERIKIAPKLGHATDLRALITFSRLFGAFGKIKNSLRYIARRMYETSQYQEFDETTGKLRWKVNDITAYQRLDNVISGKKSMIPEELEFFRLCLRKVFGDNYVAKITDDEIRLGKAHLLVRRLLSECSPLDWANIDPMQSLLNLALASKPHLQIEMIIKGHEKSWIDREGGPDIQFPNFQPQCLSQGAKFYLEISRSSCPKAPLIIEFSYMAGIDKEGNLVRAQLLPPAKATDYGHGPWRVSEPYAQPFVVSKSLGRFGFLAIGGAGQSIYQLFPNECDPYALINDDLKYLFEALAQIASSGDIPNFGILYYDVV